MHAGKIHISQILYALVSVTLSEIGYLTNILHRWEAHILTDLSATPADR